MITLPGNVEFPELNILRVKVIDIFVPIVVNKNLDNSPNLIDKIYLRRLRHKLMYHLRSFYNRRERE